MFDAHNHLQRFEKPGPIVARMREVGITGCVVNGTSEADWSQVAGLARVLPGFVHPAFGLHPWQAGNQSSHWLSMLEELLETNPGSSIGECGLDGWVEGPSLEDQQRVFLPQIALARERNLPITIHALKAWESLFEALKKEPPPERGFLLHSFGGSEELVKRLADMGAWFSFSGYFLHPKKHKVLDVYRSVPRERLLIETDAPDMLPPEEFLTEPLPDNLNHPANLKGVLRGLSLALEMPEQELEELTSANAARYFA